MHPGRRGCPSLAALTAPRLRVAVEGLQAVGTSTSGSAEELWNSLAASWLRGGSGSLDIGGNGHNGNGGHGNGGDRNNNGRSERDTLPDCSQVIVRPTLDRGSVCGPES